MDNNEIAAYTAGIIDGEGTIYIHKVGRWYNLCVGASNTDEGLILWLQSQWGGSTFADHRELNRNSSYRTLYMWTVQGKKATKMLSIILPYMIVKKPQAKLSLSFEKVQRLDVGEIDGMPIEELFRERMKSLNGHIRQVK